MATGRLGKGGKARMRYVVGEEEEPPGEPADGHPRLMVTGDAASPTLTELKARLATGGAQHTHFQNFVNVFCKTAANGGMLDTYVSEGWRLENGAEIYGFLLLTYPVTGINYHQVTSIANLETPFLGVIDAMLAGGASNQRAVALGVAYDWAQGSLTGTRSGASVPRLTEIVNFIKASTSNDTSGGLFHHARSSDRLKHHFLGLAYEGDGIDDSDATVRVNLRSAAVTAVTGTRAGYNAVAPNGGAPTGRGYINTLLEHWQLNEMLYADSWRTAKGATGEFNSGVNSWLEYWPQWLVHYLAPYKPLVNGLYSTYLMNKSTETVDDLGDGAANWARMTSQGQHDPTVLKMIAARYASTNSTMAALAMWLYKTLMFDGGFVPQGPSNEYVLRHTVYGDFIGYNTVADQSPSTLGLETAIWFNPLGTIFVRDNWNFDGTSSWFKFECAPYVWKGDGYGPTHPAAFELARRGPLIITPGSGAHSPSQECGWGSNTVIFPKPAETRSGRTYWDKGAARIGNSFGFVDEHTDFAPGSTWDVGGLKSGTGKVLLPSGANRPYCYIFADPSKWYNGTQKIDSENSSKVEYFERQVVRFPPVTPGTTPGYLVIFDRTRSTGTDVEQRWLLHPFAHTTPGTKTMAISGHSSTGNDLTRNSVTTTRWDGSGGTMMGTISGTVHGMSPKAFWSPLLPSSCRIIERGGPGSGEYSINSHEWEDPYGYQGGMYGLTGGQEAPYSGYAGAGTDLRPWTGSYRYELLAQTTAQTMNFLNVIEDVENSAGSRTSLTTLSGTNTSGVRIDRSGTRLATVFKNATGTMASGDFELTVGSGTVVYYVLITDLPTSAARTFTMGSNISEVQHVETAETGLTYTSSAEGTMWLKVTVTADGSGATNRVSWT